MNDYTTFILKLMRRNHIILLALSLLSMSMPAHASKLIEVKVIDKDYLMVHFRDGEVRYRDNGTGPSAYLGHSFAEGDDTLLVFGERLKVTEAQQASRWRVSSSDDPAFGESQPLEVWRKSKPMNTDHTLTSELDHWLFLHLPHSMRQGRTYHVNIPKDIGSDQLSANIRFDVSFNN